jgi:hypothetical protein
VSQQPRRARIELSDRELTDQGIIECRPQVELPIRVFGLDGGHRLRIECKEQQHKE